MKRISIYLFCALGVVGTLLFVFTQKASAATCQTIASGTWNSTSIWSCGYVPTQYDTATIQSIHSVTLGSTPTNQPYRISIYGQLRVTGAVTLSGQIIVYSSGRITGTTTSSNLTYTASTFNNSGLVATTITFNRSGGQTISGNGQWTLDYSQNPPAICKVNINGTSRTTLSQNTTFNMCSIQVNSSAEFGTGIYTLLMQGYGDYEAGTGYGITNAGTINGTGEIQTTQQIRIIQSGSFSAPLRVTGGTTQVNGSNLSGNVTVNSGANLIGGMDNTGSMSFRGTTLTNNGTVFGNVIFNGTTQGITGAGSWKSSYLESTPIDCRLTLSGSSVTSMANAINFAQCTLQTNIGTQFNTGSYIFAFEGDDSYVAGSGHGIINSGTIAGTGPVQTSKYVRINQSGTFTAPLNVAGTYGSTTQIATSTGYAFGGNVTVGTNARLIGGIDNVGSMSFSGTSFVNNSSGTVSGNVTFNGTGQSISGAGIWQSGYLYSTPIGCQLTVGSPSASMGSNLSFNQCTLQLNSGAQFNMGSYTLNLTGATSYAADANPGITNNGVIAGTGQIRTQAYVYINQAGTLSTPLYVAGGRTQIRGSVQNNIESATGTTLELRNNLTVNGNWVQHGSLIHNNYALTFNGAGSHNFSVFVATAFYGLVINDGVTVIETETANNISLASGGSIVTSGSGRLIKALSVSTGGSYTFGLTGVQITVDSISGSSPSIQVDRIEGNHPNATAGVATGRYWSITPINATSYQVDLTLPHPYPADPGQTKVCRYTGSEQVWDCAQSSSTGATVTRLDLTQLSEWAVGYHVGPTPVTLKMFAAQPSYATTPITRPTIVIMVIIMLFISIWLWNQRQSQVRVRATNK